MKKSPHLAVTKFVALAAAITLSATPAFADDGTWSANGGAWTNSANWSGGIVPGAIGTTDNADTALFGNIGAASVVTNVNNFNIKNITISNANAFTYTISSGSFRLSSGGVILNALGSTATAINPSIEIQGDGGSATVTANASGALTLGGPISGVSTAGNTTTVTLNGSSTAVNTLNQVISDGSGGGKLAVVKDGSGTWSITTGANVNTFSGGVTLNAGTINIAKASALGTGTFTINGGTFTGGLSGGTLTISDTVINGNFTAGINSAISLGSGNVSLGTAAGTSRSFSGHSTQALTIDGVISDGTTVNKIIVTGNTALVLNGANTFTGGLTLSRMTLTLGNSSALGTGDLTLTSDSGNNSLNVTSGLTFSNNLVLSNSLALAGTGDMTWAGNVVNAGGSRVLNRTGRTDITGNVYLSEASGTGRGLTLGGANNGNGSISGVIANFNGSPGTAGSITKAGTGTWTLSGTNTYTGTTTVSAGALIINGDNSAATGAVAVATNATLGGSGTIGGNTGIANGGTVSPGNSPGTITFANNLSMSNGSTLIFEAGDLVNVGGVLDLDNAWKLTLSANANWQLGGTTVLFDYGTLAASPWLTPAITDNTGLGGSLSLSSDGSTILLNGYSVVPEPSTYALLGLTGIAAIGYRLRRRNR